MRISFVIAYTLMEFLNIYFCYCIVLESRLQKKVWIYVVTLAIPCIVQIVFGNSVGNKFTDYVIAGTSLLIIPIWAKEEKIKCLLRFPIVYIGFSTLNAIGVYLLSFAVGKTYLKVVDTPIYVLLTECTAILVILPYKYWKNRREKAGDKYEADVKQHILLLVGLLNIAVVAAMVKSMGNAIHFSQKERHRFDFSSVIIVFLFILINVWYQSVFKRAQNYQKQARKYELYMQQQEEHIKSLIRQDENMRRFRHDFHAHMTALKAYVGKIQEVQLQKYIDDMCEGSVLDSMQNYTGVAALDAVIGDLMQQTGQAVKLKWEGVISNRERVELFDLCTIFFNLLSNAIEACEKQNEDEKKYIFVKVYCYEEKIYLDVKNPILENTTVKNTHLPETTKESKENHGFGLRNVKETVKKNDGHMEIRIEDGWFEVEILI